MTESSFVDFTQSRGPLGLIKRKGRMNSWHLS